MRHLVLLLALVGCGHRDVQIVDPAGCGTLSEALVADTMGLGESYFGDRDFESRVYRVIVLPKADAAGVCGGSACLYNLYHIVASCEDREYLLCQDILHELGHAESIAKYGDADYGHGRYPDFYGQYIFDACQGEFGL